jgi:hypothetical protein
MLLNLTKKLVSVDNENREANFGTKLFGRPLYQLVSPRGRQCVQGTSIVGGEELCGIFSVTFVQVSLETGHDL